MRAKHTLVFLILSILLTTFFLIFNHCTRNRNAKNEDNNTWVRDIEGNRYPVKAIGIQYWMVKNLAVSKFRNGDPIPHAVEEAEWSGTSEAVWCHYKNDKKAGSVYGKLYNWYAVNDPRGICPDGWHVPADEEWQQLADFLGGDKVAGNKMKESGSIHWAEPNTGASNESGFTALPGGGRDELGKFIIDRYGGFWWSSAEDGSTDAVVRSTFYGYGSILKDSYNKKSGFSIRCLKDNGKF